MDVGVAVAAIAACASAAAAIMVGRRKTSGRIGTSEASDLWAESRARNVEIYARLDKAEAAYAACVAREIESMQQTARLQRETAGLQQELAALKAIVKREG